MTESAIKYELLDGDARHLETPSTFEMPSKADRAAIRGGDYVKLGFHPLPDGPPRGERMWVVVAGHTPKGYLGVLDNDPAQDWGAALQHGDPIAFEAKHILAIMKRRAESPLN